MTEKRFHYDWKTGRFKDTQSNSCATSNMRVLETQINNACSNYEKTIKKLEKENKEIKNDEEQLSINFLGYKMKLKKILQKRYAYADEQCQKNLNNPIIYKVYDMIRYDVKKLAEEMGVDLK